MIQAADAKTPGDPPSKPRELKHISLRQTKSPRTAEVENAGAVSGMAAIRRTLTSENRVRRVHESGDFVMSDNHRTLHARTGFDDTRRQFRICNVPRETLHERLRLPATANDCGDEVRMALPAGAVR